VSEIPEEKPKPHRYPHEFKIGKHCDMWALGCIIYHLITGDPFMDCKNIGDLVKSRYEFKKLSKVDPTLKKKLSPEFYDFLKGLLRKKGKTRLTINQALNHKFILYGVAYRYLTQVPKSIKCEVVSNITSFASNKTVFYKLFSSLAVKYFLSPKVRKQAISRYFLYMDRERKGSIDLRKFIQEDSKDSHVLPNLKM